MFYPWESKAREVLQSWDQAIGLYEDYRDDVERSIREYEDLERKYDFVCYSVLEAEDQIKELEKENLTLKRMLEDLINAGSEVANGTSFE